MKLRRILLFILFLLPLIASFSLAKPEFAKKESKACAYCHVKLGSKELNQAGKYYKEHGYSFKGYEVKKK